MIQLVLQGLGTGTDDGLAATQERRDQVRERLASAGSGFDDEPL